MENFGPEEKVSRLEYFPLKDLIFQILGKKNFAESHSDVYIEQPEQFCYVLYGSNYKCWREISITEPETRYRYSALELIKADSLEVKGKAPMRIFVPCETYDVYFTVMMRDNAVVETPCAFTLVVVTPTTPVDRVLETRLLDLNELPRNQLLCVKMGRFTATPDNGQVKYSLTNFDPHWKSGIVFVNVFFKPVKPQNN